ncbi:MAG: type I 3-dehydroquinate dehydratase [Nitrospirae bacterium]|nr:type I 3-dehydroquinate dehydratase [Nitrospirota bacterium]
MAGNLGRFAFNVQFPVAGVWTGKGTPKDLAAWRALGPDLVEIRLDLFPARPFPEYPRLIEDLKKVLPCPFLLTIRSKEEGGGGLVATLREEQRRSLFEGLVDAVDGVDIELSAPIAKQVVGLCRARGRMVVVSAHDFKKTPTDAQLRSLLKKAISLKPDFVKISALARSPEEALRLLALPRENPKVPLVVMPMGDASRGLRILAPVFGSRWTYAYLDAPTAPGQISLADYREIVGRL